MIRRSEPRSNEGAISCSPSEGARRTGGDVRAIPFGFIRSARCLALVYSIVLASLVAPTASGRSAATFVSKQYGYSIVLPGKSSRWDTRFAITNWSTNAIEHDSPAFDLFTDLQTGRFYFLAARPSGSSLARWTTFVVSARPSVCRAPKPLPNSTLAGVPARVLTWLCSDGYTVFVIAALHAGRGYVMLAASPTALSRTSDLRAFNAVRGSFRFPKS